MADISDFKNLVAVDVFPCPDPIVSREVLSAIIEFCDKTFVLSKTFNHPFDSTGIDTDLLDSYELDVTDYVDQEMRPASVRKMYIDGTEWPVKKKNIVTDIPDWNSIKDSTVKYYSFPDKSTVLLYDMSDTYQNITLEVAFKPVRTATVVDDILLDEWAEPIVAGAKAHLLDMPGKDWSDPKLARLFEREWRRGISRAKAQVTAEGSSETTRVPWQTFGG